MNREKTLEAILVIAIGFLIVFLIKHIQLFLYLSISVGLIGILVKPLAVFIAKLWYKLGDWLGWFVSKIVLGIIFYLVVLPVSTFYKFFNKDTLRIKRSNKSFWYEKNHKYISNDLKNSW